MQSLCLICRDTKGQWWSTVERAQQAQQKRREACCLLTSVITEDQGMLQHLKATVHALGAVHSISLDKAKEMYMRGTEFDSSEITQLGEQLQSHSSSKARQKLDSFLSNYKKALECEEFLRRL
uniref:uncharacterized protein LOC122764077 isoform X1 n=2 Tax=Solea senegalensis TaxID=28829 RepID=UPI001CD88FED|nr:uncharacterized protein LOC122764077 isoform X1 [Solea senegalensis]